MEHQGTRVIETTRLHLRPFTMNDVQVMYHNWASDEEVTKYLTWPAHGDLDVTRRVLLEWVESYGRKDYYQWAIVLKEQGTEPIGSISVVSFDEAVGKAQIGYCIGRPWWGCGITSKALQAVINFLFKEVGVNRVEARHDTRNPASGKVMGKCGMIYEGTLRQSDRNNQGICDASWYAILRQDREGAKK